MEKSDEEIQKIIINLHFLAIAYLPYGFGNEYFAKNTARPKINTTSTGTCSWQKQNKKEAVEGGKKLKKKPET